MILDSSAIVAILLREPEHEALQSKIAAAPSLGVGTPTLLETAIVLSARLERNAQKSNPASELLGLRGGFGRYSLREYRGASVLFLCLSVVFK